jgi:hypothetical protein
MKIVEVNEAEAPERHLSPVALDRRSPTMDDDDSPVPA